MAEAEICQTQDHHDQRESSGRLKQRVARRDGQCREFQVAQPLYFCPLSANRPECNPDEHHRLDHRPGNSLESGGHSAAAAEYPETGWVRGDQPDRPEPADLQLMSGQRAGRESRQDHTQGNSHRQDRLPDVANECWSIDPGHRGPAGRSPRQSDQTASQVFAPEAEQQDRDQPAASRRELRAMRDLPLLARNLQAAFRGRLGSVLGHGTASGVIEFGTHGPQGQLAHACESVTARVARLRKIRTIPSIERTGRESARKGTAGASRPIQPRTMPATASAMATGAAARSESARAPPTWAKTCETAPSFKPRPPAGTAR